MLVAPPPSVPELPAEADLEGIPQPIIRELGLRR
jgi:hypothetical protein